MVVNHTNIPDIKVVMVQRNTMLRHEGPRLMRAALLAPHPWTDRTGLSAEEASYSPKNGALCKKESAADGCETAYRSEAIACKRTGDPYI